MKHLKTTLAALIVSVLLPTTASAAPTLYKIYRLDVGKDYIQVIAKTQNKATYVFHLRDARCNNHKSTY